VSAGIDWFCVATTVGALAMGWYQGWVFGSTRRRR
jgi:hypothetical protein